MAVDVSAEVDELFLVEAAVELNQGEANDQVVIAASLVPIVVFALVPEDAPVDAAKVLIDLAAVDVAVKGDELVPNRLAAKRNEIVPWDQFLIDADLSRHTRGI